MPRGRPPKLEPCFKCPVGVLFTRKELKRKSKMDLCPFHYEEHINKDKTIPWPSCPDCGVEYDDFAFIRAKDYRKTKIVCLVCNKATPASNIFTEIQMSIYVKPIEKFA